MTKNFCSNQVIYSRCYKQKFIVLCLFLIDTVYRQYFNATVLHDKYILSFTLNGISHYAFGKRNTTLLNIQNSNSHVNNVTPTSQIFNIVFQANGAKLGFSIFRVLITFHSVLLPSPVIGTYFVPPHTLP